MSRESVMKLFKEVDISGDGTLSMVEVKKIVMLINGCTSDEVDNEEVLKYFADNDKDGDNKISFEEFYKTFQLRDNKDVPDSELAEKFKSMDRDGNGFIDAAECEVLLCNRKGYTPELAAKYLAKIDKDKDGKISLEEFLRDFKGQ